MKSRQFRSIRIGYMALAVCLFAAGEADGCFSTQRTPASTNYYDSRDWLIQTVNNPRSTIRATTSFTDDEAGRLIMTTVLCCVRRVSATIADGRNTATTNADQESPASNGTRAAR